MTSIEDYVFYGCSSLESITIPEGVTSIGNDAFQDCSSLTSIKIPEGVISIEPWAFGGCSSLTNITIPEGVTSIGYSTFYGCSSLESITIPEGVISIGDYAFYDCSSLTSITIPEGVTSIGFRAFYGCSSLESITIPEGVTSIGESAFDGCSSLTNITIPEGVTSIGESAFDGCSSLTNITIPEGVTSIERYTFTGCSSIMNITIPESVTSIGDQAFTGCRSITNITIPESVTSIGDSAFNGCSSLMNITIPEGVNSIGDYAFTVCSKLKKIKMPKSVISIGQSAFDSYGVVLWCYSNSYAEKYAKDNEFIYNGKTDGYDNAYRLIDKMESYFDMITLSQEEYVYDGAEKEPEASIEGMQCGKDFDVSYSNNVNAGTATVTLTGKENYSGTVTRDFTIKAIDINNNENKIELSDDTYEYDGKEKRPEVTIAGLVNGQDYEVTYDNNINAGTATVTATCKGNYSGVLSKSFTITPKSIQDFDTKATLSQDTYEYDGTAKMPKVTIPGLVEGQDFDVTYDRNVDAGTATVTLAGKGNYKGNITKDFTITARPLEKHEAELKLSQNTFVYSGMKIQPEVTIPGLIRGSDFVVFYEKNVNVGTATVTVTGTGNYKGAITKTFTITAKSVETYKDDMSLSKNSYEYDGTAKQPEVTIPGLVQGQDFEVTYDNNINAGTATVKLTGKGNYCDTITGTFTITTKAIDQYEKKMSLSQDIFEYDGTQKEPVVTIEGLEQGNDFDVAYANNINVGTATVTVSGKGNYDGTIKKLYTIIEKSIENYEKDFKLSQDTYEYDGTEKKPTVTIFGLTQGTDFEVVYSNNVDVGVATVTIIGKGNLNKTITRVFTITPKPIDKLKDDIKLSQITYSYDGKAKEPKVTIEGLTQGKDFEVSYADNVNVGTATVTITGKGNYSGSIQIIFEIKSTETPTPEPTATPTPEPTETPTPEPTATPTPEPGETTDPSENPTPNPGETTEPSKDPTVTPEPQKVLYGDVDNSGTVDASDALQVLKFAAKLETPTEEQVKAGDVDGNGTLDAADALEILRKAARLIDVFTVESKTI